MKQLIMSSYLEEVIESYYKDGAKKLHNIVDKILFKLHFHDVDRDEFYSMANEVFVSIINNYDDTKSFDGFLYSCLYKKFCSLMTESTRYKRCTKIKIQEEDVNGKIVEVFQIIPDEYLDAPLKDNENLTLGDTIASDTTIEREVFEKGGDGLSRKMILYLNKLSVLQKKVLWLMIAGYVPGEIREELHINNKQYANCIAAIRAYRNVSVLF
jgi:hypothetical protein